MIQQIFDNQQLIENLGWTLIHSCWQISVIGLLLLLSLRVLKNASANLRYSVSITAMILLVALPAATFFSFKSVSMVKTEANFTKTVENSKSQSLETTRETNENLNALEEIPDFEKDNEIISENEFAGFQNQIKSSLNKFLPYLVWAWFLGVLLFSFRFCGGIWKVHQFKTYETSSVGNDWQKRFDVLSKNIGIRRTVNFIKSEVVETPMVIGWLKTFVIIPSSILAGINPRELETIIAHELIHIRRHDYFVNVLQSFIEIILFFHPVTWWISAQVRRERENACDDEVLKIFDGESLIYANALANLENLRFQTNNLTSSTGIAANGGNLMQRIQRIIERKMEKQNPKESFRSLIPAFLLVAISLSVISVVIWQVNVNKSEAKTNTAAKKIAISLYAASTVIPSENPPEDVETMRLVVEKLKQHKIPTVGFLSGVKVNIHAENIPEDQEKIVSLWREAGFEIGVLNLKYPQSFNSTIAEYQAAIKSRAAKLDPYYQKQIDIFKNFKKVDFKKFSLEEKKSYFEELKKQREPLEKSREEIINVEKEWMKDNNLTRVKYTFGTHDWIYSYTYDVARKENNREMMNRIKAAYIGYLSKSLDYYEKYSQQLFERNIPQTIPLTPSRLLADSADELFAMLQKHGYQFVSMDEAMQDEAYQSAPISANGTGSSWLDKVDLERHLPSPEKPNADLEKITKSFPGKPNVDVDVLKIWEENQPINRKIVEN